MHWVLGQQIRYGPPRQHISWDFTADHVLHVQWTVAEVCHELTALSPVCER